MLSLIRITGLAFIISLIAISRSLPTDSLDQANVSTELEQVNAVSLQGALLMPTEGAEFVNQGGAMGNIQIVYHCPKSQPINLAVGGRDRTVAIDVILVPRREDGFRPGPEQVVLARGLRPRNGLSGEKIQTNFVPPISTCGDYRMVVTENQIFDNMVVQVSAGAPAVSVACSPMEDF
ncbi:hypothetical protein O181_039805 [Austropuccinia psidii MF-1]|uniref:Uncharacterized protein n=1 Tax=Austropuccinia psidii MF-1 TaxID=1389203 RepID=A0A9Q3DFJ4_9BASI|nr:hypothetical protein [Austropuccinia psidii MF-1]